jgi:prepilin-type processing-associated H-X9-DG protein
VQAAREAARRSQCVNNLKQTQLGMLNFNDAHKVFPAGRKGLDGEAGLGPFAEILPFIEEQTLYELMDPIDQPWDDTKPGQVWAAIENNLKFNATVVPTYRCPTDPTPATHKSSVIEWSPGDDTLIAVSSYGVNWGTSGSTGTANKKDNSGVFNYKVRYATKKILDGLSKTMFVGEIQARDDLENPLWTSTIPWSQGCRRINMRTTDKAMNVPFDLWYAVSSWRENAFFGSHHSGGAHFAFGDGHVAFLDENIDLDTYRALSTRAGKNEMIQVEY